MALSYGVWVWESVHTHRHSCLSCQLAGLEPGDMSRDCSENSQSGDSTPRPAAAPMRSSPASLAVLQLLEPTSMNATAAWPCEGQSEVLCFSSSSLRAGVGTRLPLVIHQSAIISSWGPGRVLAGKA